jgi:hypothetical protein
MNINDNDKDKYKMDFTAWSDQVERYLRRGIMTFVILLCLSQLVLQFPSARQWFTLTDDAEGVPFHYVSH